MPVYRYKHNCGYAGDQFLSVDKESLQLQCNRCGRQVTARQVRDKGALFREKDGTTGILRRNG